MTPGRSLLQNTSGRSMAPCASTTWRARTSCLEPQAEPKIRAKALELLQRVAQVDRSE